MQGRQESKPQGRLFEKVITSGVWVITLKVVQQVLYLLQLLVIGRFLSPADFGVFGLAMLVLATVNRFTQTGFQAALIQQKHDIRPYLNSTWTFGILRAVFLAGLLFLLAPWVVAFFRSDNTVFDAHSAIVIMRVMALTVVIGAFNNVGIIYFTKDLVFRKQFILQSSQALATTLVTIITALWWRNVWSLVAGKLAGSVVTVVASYMLHSYRPGFTLDMGKLSELFRYGKWILSTSILGFLIQQGDNAFVSKYLGLSALGLYLMAYKISQIPATALTNVFGTVTFSAYARIQDDIDRLRQAYLKTLHILLWVSFGCAGGILVMAPDFVVLLMKSRWLPMVSVLQVLAISGLIHSFGGSTVALFRAAGRPHVVTKLNVVKLIVLAVTIYPFSRYWGLAGAAWAVVVSALFLQPYVCFLIIRVLKCKLTELLKVIVLPLLATVIMMHIVLINRILLGRISVYNHYYNYLYFLELIIAGSVSYILLAYILDLVFDYGIGKVVREQMAVLKKQAGKFINGK